VTIARAAPSRSGLDSAEKNENLPAARPCDQMHGRVAGRWRRRRAVGRRWRPKRYARSGARLRAQRRIRLGQRLLSAVPGDRGMPRLTRRIPARVRPALARAWRPVWGRARQKQGDARRQSKPERVPSATQRWALECVRYPRRAAALHEYRRLAVFSVTDRQLRVPGMHLERYLTFRSLSSRNRRKIYCRVR